MTDKTQENIEYAQQLEAISDRLWTNKETAYERGLASAALLRYSELVWQRSVNG